MRLLTCDTRWRGFARRVRLSTNGSGGGLRVGLGVLKPFDGLLRRAQAVQRLPGVLVAVVEALPPHKVLHATFDRKTPHSLFVCFPSVCPEPVFVK